MGNDGGGPGFCDSPFSRLHDLGYAEADPSLDIDGIDTAHKLTTILILPGFWHRLFFLQSLCARHRDVSALDIRFAGEFGYNISL